MRAEFRRSDYLWHTYSCYLLAPHKYIVVNPFENKAILKRFAIYNEIDSRQLRLSYQAFRLYHRKKSDLIDTSEEL